MDERPVDPFEGLSPAARKRAQESAILSMVYDLSDFSTVVERERPDFALYRGDRHAPIGVEVTQLFQNESHARLALVPHYMQQLWAGGPHLHKHDVKTLDPVKVEVTDAAGNVKQTDVPAIFSPAPTLGAFHAGLAAVIRDKSERGYATEDFLHTNLVILDWYHLAFDPDDYLTDRFYSEEVRIALRESPFREVFLLMASTTRAQPNDTQGEPVPSEFRSIPLQQILAMERFYVTAQVINTQCGDYVADLAHLVRLTIDHVTRVQGYGESVMHEGRPFMHYKGTLIEVSDAGMQVRDCNDFPLSDVTPCAIEDRLPSAEEARVAEASADHVFGSAYAPAAQRSHLWR